MRRISSPPNLLKNLHLSNNNMGMMSNNNMGMMTRLINSWVGYICISEVNSQSFIGSQRDTHGCVLDGGYQWCDTTQKCQRPWSEPCPEMHHLERCTKDFCENPEDCPKCKEGYECKISEDMMCAGTCYGQCVPLSLGDSSKDCLVSQPCSSEYVCPFIKSCIKDGIPGYTTYILALRVKDQHISGIYALFGSEQHPLYIPKAYHVPRLHTNIGGHPPIHSKMNSDSRYDSWLTIGVTDGNDGLLSSIGIDFTKWSETTSEVVSDGAVFAMNPLKMPRRKDYVIAQITIPTHVTEQLKANVQGHFQNSEKTWKATNIIFTLGVEKSRVPEDCISWYDGCNTCRVSQGDILGCTRMMCFKRGDPYCRKYSTAH